MRVQDDRIVEATLLIVDDNVEICEAVSQGLEIPGVKIHFEVAYDGASGLIKAREFKPDVIILDLQMPGGDGFTVHEQLRQEEAFKDTKVLLLTAQDNAKNMWESIDRGIDDFLGKPFDLVELEARVYNLLTQIKEGKTTRGVL